MKPRLLYVTHVDWGHIRQRPHHMATGLAEHFDVTVAAPLSRRRAQLVENPHLEIRVIPLFRLPGSYRSGRMLALNNRACALQLRALASRQAADIVLVTSPECYSWVAPWLGERRLAYDCMDDALAFEQDAGVRAAKDALERALFERANVVTCSSATLARRCKARGAAAERVHLLPNGWDPLAFPVEHERALLQRGPLSLVYFGTISRWLDTASLEAVARACPQDRIRLVGPNESGYVPEAPNITVIAPVPHAELAQSVADCDALLLPFKVDELVRAVDPVKLYEYIALGRPIACVRYEEIERFGEFVTLYDTTAELADIVKKRSFAPARPQAARATFLRNQSWSARVAAFAPLLADPAAALAVGAPA